LGNWCGYVAVPPSHPDHDADYSDVPVDVHGGLTYGARCDGDEEDGICHVPHGGEPADVFWLGFDCAHYSDLVPEVEAYGVKDPTATYRDLDYVRAETNGLAEQLAVPA
jgi:hypothetical protein